MLLLVRTGYGVLCDPRISMAYNKGWFLSQAGQQRLCSGTWVESASSHPVFWQREEMTQPTTYWLLQLLLQETYSTLVHVSLVKVSHVAQPVLQGIRRTTPRELGSTLVSTQGPLVQEVLL